MLWYHPDLTPGDAELNAGLLLRHVRVLLPEAPPPSSPPRVFMLRAIVFSPVRDGDVVPLQRGKVLSTKREVLDEELLAFQNLPEFRGGAPPLAHAQAPPPGGRPAAGEAAGPRGGLPAPHEPRDRGGARAAPRGVRRV